MKGHVYSIIAVVLMVLVLLTGLRTTTMFRLGIENIPQKFITLLQKKSVGLISNQSGRDQNGCRSVDILLAHGIRVKKMFIPEYECNSSFFSAVDTVESIDEPTGIVTVNLYDKDGIRAIDLEMLDGIDAFLLDLQDVGMRHHSYLSTLLHMMQAAQQHNKMFVIFDRPNPLGYIMEGTIVDYKKKSPVTAIPVPVRHGLTIGELAWYCNMHVLKHPANLVVVKMAHYNRDKERSYINLNTSPGEIKREACLGYSFLELLREISPFHVSCSANGSFSTIMLPENKGISRLRWLALAHTLEESSIESEYNQCSHNGLIYSGLKITVNDIDQVSSCGVLMALFDFCKDHNITLSFSDSFDSVVGTSGVRDMLQNRFSMQALTQRIDGGLAQFHASARASCMYMPLPQICN